MAIGDDFSVTISGSIRHISGTDRYTVLQLHRWLQDMADNTTSSGNDYIDITSETPSERSTDNIITLLGDYNIDDTAAEYFYDGSISQSGGNTLYSGLTVVGAVNQTTTLQIIQNNALYDGASPFWGTGINSDAASNILMRCLVKTRTSGADIDGKRIRVIARELGDTYAEFSVTMGLGNSTAAIFTSQDLNNQTASGTIAGWTTITNVWGYQTIDLSNGNGPKPYYSEWNRDTYSINQLYERAKWLTARDSSETIYDIPAYLFRGITHQWNYDNEANGPFIEGESITWGTGATFGAGVILALKDDGTTGTMWIQLLTGVAPSADTLIIGGSSSASCDVNGSVTSRSLSPCFIGQSTGSAMIGAFGIGIESADLSKDDKLFDLTNTLQQPPNTLTFSVTGLVSGEDRVLVGPKAAGDSFAFDQLTLQTSLNGAGTTSIVVTASIPSDTPATGTLRLELDSGYYTRIAYTSWTGSTFTIGSTDFTAPNNATAGANVMISYIDKLADASSASFSTIYSTDRSLFVRVRDGGASPIKTFSTPATLGSGGGSVAAIRTSDA